MDRQKAHSIEEGLLEEASLWHARVTDVEAGEDTWLAFTHWLEADDLNRIAYDQVEELSWDLEEQSESIRETIKAHEENVRSVDGDGTVIQAAWRWRNRNIWGGLAAAAAAVMLVIANTGLFTSPEVVTQEFLTEFGEQQLVRLDDGSTVHLNTNSKLVVTFEKDRRQTQLAYGEALFSVAKDVERPFFVAVGDRQVRVVGTKFNVLRHAGLVTVTVAEGIVDVSAEIDGGQVDQSASRLTAGKQLVHADGDTVSTVSDVEAETFLSWETGILAYDEAPLVFTINELSRYFEKPIKIEGDISNITFSGILNVRDQDAVLQLLEETLPIKITRNDGAIVVTANK